MDTTLTHLQRVHTLALYADIQVCTRRVDHHDALNRLGNVFDGVGMVRSTPAFAFARTQLRPKSDQRTTTLWTTRDTDGPSTCHPRTVASVCSCSRVLDAVVA